MKKALAGMMRDATMQVVKERYPEKRSEAMITAPFPLGIPRDRWAMTPEEEFAKLYWEDIQDQLGRAGATVARHGRASFCGLAPGATDIAGTSFPTIHCDKLQLTLGNSLRMQRKLRIYAESEFSIDNCAVSDFDSGPAGPKAT